MEYQNIVNLSNKTSRFKTKNWVEINDDSRGTCDVGSLIKFKTTTLKSSLCDYSDAFIHVKGTITVNNTCKDNNTMYNLIKYSDNYSKTS